MLEVTDLQVRYQGIEALKGVSFRVLPGKIVTLIGANGAGKSTILRAIAGLVRPAGGTIRFQGNEISRQPVHRITRGGISLVPEGRKVFTNLSVLENLAMGAYTRPRDASYKKDLEWIWSIFPRLKERIRQQAGTLSGGEQQMLALGRALMSAPKLLMMDEPSLGLAPQLVAEVFNVIRKIHANGMTILLIEQNAWGALEAADYAYVLETGEVVLEGSGQALLDDDGVRKAYLGED
ncbi:MAG: ABC transporter ATP-binding protein [Deltaproteobacteria bacterium]|nr:ABC transporter ATP-binding protein [Deltaproteobacteria bacterium]